MITEKNQSDSDLGNEPKQKKKKEEREEVIEDAKTVKRDTADVDFDIDTEPVDDQEKLIEAPIMVAHPDELDPGRDVGKKKQTGVPIEGIDLPVDDFDPTKYDLDSGRMVVEDEDEEEDEDE